MTPDKRLTQRDMIRHARYNQILNLCKNPKKPKTGQQLADALENFSYEIIMQDMKMMIPLGYIQMNEVRTTKWNQRTKVFTALKDRFLLSDIMPSSVMKQINRAAREKAGIEWSENNKPKQEALPNGRIMRLMDDAEHFAKMNQCRNKPKSARNFVSGSLLSGVF
jgi:hypothetical protein